ncbi:cyclic di-GMP phosphodiesterase response regulator RpfG [mine drainage metagenome]|uniref:Cyclic di-GMP phosphodiesterase response regulator RpfG n=1 Tax=mine drainage metagenome TaxID=410659 RepID=A0A1J5PUF4_9ZZZZ
MMPISLSKLIKKQSLMPVLVRLAGDLDTALAIEDASGKLLLATEGLKNLSRYPVTAANEVIGWVVGTGKVAMIATVLSRLAEAESDKQSLATETLGKYKEITLLCDSVEKLASCLDTQEVARLVIEEARKVIQLSGMALFLLDKNRAAMELLGQYGLALGASVVLAASNNFWLSGHPEIINEVQADPRFATSAVAVRSLMYAPLKAQGAVVGVIIVGHDLALSYSAEDLKLLTTLASLAASAIENASLYEQLQAAFYSTVYTLAETIEKRDPYTGNHTKRVLEYSLAIGHTLGLSTQEQNRLKLGAVLHDIGKIGVRDSILLKESRLSSEEFEQIKKHPVIGQEILANIAQLKPAIAGVLQHHEKFDGTGYPGGLKGESIDLTARIIAVADSFDAMTSNRPYRDGLSIEVAFDELRKYSGSQFDPKVVDAFFTSDVMEAFFAANSRQKIIL